jgi:glycosyltransferase involved in cell wall biosynthesis
MPRKYGGLCLPLNEASACGMPVLMTAIPPQDELLAPEALLPARKVGSFTAHTAIDVFETTPQAIAERITQLHREPALVARLSDAADAYADSISWNRLGPEYLRVFEDLASR